MKKTIFLAICILVMTVSFAQALPLYTVQTTDGRVSPGGPFLITGGGQSFQTFCIEAREYIGLPGSYYGSIDPKVWYSSGDSSTRGIIADETKKLYSYFLDNYGTLTNADKSNIQLAIWDYQGQPDYDGLQGLNPFYIAAPDYKLTHNVLALNLWTNVDGYVYGSRAQSMLMVPEPASMLLFGLGLLGLAGIRRKLKK